MSKALEKNTSQTDHISNKIETPTDVRDIALS